jgi:hypothetical protein
MNSTKYNVVKDAMNPWGTPITAGSVVEFTDADMADAKVGPAVQALIADGSIVAVVAAQGGTVAPKPGVATPPAQAPAKPAAQTQVAPKPQAAQQVAPAPKQKKRHISGKLVVVDGERVVGDQTFHHIQLEDGSEMDLTELQYRHEVHPTL